MRPDEARAQGPVVPRRQLLPASPERALDTSAQAASIVRDQISAIYQKNAATSGSPEPDNPYERTHTSAHVAIQANQWRQYHSAWQEYYQKYYERYYIGQVYQARQSLEQKGYAAAQSQPIAPGTAGQSGSRSKDASFSKDEALYDLRSKLKNQVQTSATKIRKSRHFIPISAAVCVVLFFIFLQYNSLLFANVAAYMSPGNIDPANIIVDPTTSVDVGPDPKLIIPKINVDVPVIWDTKPDYASQMAAMKNGVAWFGIPGANSKPGQIGNTPISGHSSNDVFDSGNYKFIFAQLERLVVGDTFYINYQGKRYTYTISKKEVVKPSEVGKLIYPTDKPIVTLITCTPVGTSLNRLLVTAEQVSPNPSQAQKAPVNTPASQPVTIPGTAPTVLERIFGNKGY